MTLLVAVRARTVQSYRFPQNSLHAYILTLQTLQPTSLIITSKPANTSHQTADKATTSLAASSSQAPSKANKSEIYCQTIVHCTFSRRYAKCNGYTICEALVKTMNGLPRHWDWWDRDTIVNSTMELEKLQDSDGGVIYLRGADVKLEEVYGPAAFRAARGLKMLHKYNDIREDAWASKGCE